MKTYLQWICAGLMSGSALLLSGCEEVAYTGGGAVYYDYDYYPDCDVYFYPRAHIYYWNEGGAWRSGDRLPAVYNGRVQHAEQLHLQSQQPWTEHHPAPANPVYQKHEDQGQHHDQGQNQDRGQGQGRGHDKDEDHSHDHDHDHN